MDASTLNHAFPPHHRVRDLARTVAFREGGVFADGTETAAVAEVGVDAFRVEDVLAGEFADGGALGCRAGGDVVFEADGAGGLLEGGGGVAC